jgi:uracil-DNA glycosylase
METIKILFVGDEPSKKNVDPNVPFIGTASYKRLNRWMQMISTSLATIDVEFSLYNSHTEEEINRIKAELPTTKYLVVTLGDKATKRVARALKIPVWKIGHPSPRNRTWNNPQKEIDEVRKLCDYIIKEVDGSNGI